MDVTPHERDEIAVLTTRLFGFDGESGLYGDVQEIKLKLARWDGAITMVKAGASLLGIGGIATILAALSSMAS